ncbi:MAG TPA: asparagine synthase (glutamine-hydrolyzing) [Pyrinomonadaceae bacterium]|nr:asparagine synthase (glutamine-hydrolyzing) [Pyrinomonadaceae bacterium]
MCGIAGYLTSKTLDWYDCLDRMIGQLRHRGSDDKGQWIDLEAGVALGHQRLSILDLSMQGHQPMISESGRYVIVYNGEVYNFLELQTELEKRTGATLKLRGRSDTEVILAAIETWGLNDAVKRFVGMFAFALWDRTERTLSLVRDRIGEKPLYYGWTGNVFMFGSELKALRAHPQFHADIDRVALNLLLHYDYIPAPYSIYERIYKLLPGTILTVRNNSGALPPLQPYWSAKQVYEAAQARSFQGDESEALDVIDSVLRTSIRGQMVADVPVGVFLSGGLDSSLVTALMQAQCDRPVRSFTIGFDDESMNEAPYAKAVASFLGTKHTELYVSGTDALAVVPHLAHLYDEPFADSSQIPTYIVARLAKQQVKVCLSGDGGDELFGGYPHYFDNSWLSNRRIGELPPYVRFAAGRALNRLASPSNGQSLESSTGVPVWIGPATLERLSRLGRRFSAENAEDRYHESRKRWLQRKLVVGHHEDVPRLRQQEHWARLKDHVQTMMYQDLISYLPDDILVKVDRATMGVSLEGRAPYLDHRVVEFAARLPTNFKVCRGQGKTLLRKLLYRYVPKELVERPKQGFGPPVGQWLRGPLKEWAEDLLDKRKIQSAGYLHCNSVRQIWQQHLQGGIGNYSNLLWTILLFQQWINHKVTVESDDVSVRRTPCEEGAVGLTN